jgi:myo-inositol-1-phosphate synthase
LLEKLRVPLMAIQPMTAVFDERWVPRLTPVHLKTSRNAREHVEQLRADIQNFRVSQRVQRLVMVWCGSTEAFSLPGEAHQTTAAFERALDANDASISPSMLYAYAALAEGVPFVNAAPNLTADIPALSELAMERQVPLAGKDLKTGQTLLKTIVAPALKARLLGVSGWYSTNILGNRDGLVLEDPQCFHTKEVSKVGVLDSILQPHVHPALYSDICHRVHINYYPPRGDNKEGWDNIDLFGWMNYPMQLKINFLCRDSILAAPLVLDLALFTDLASRAHCSGIQEWLSFYFKSPMHAAGAHVEHDLFVQLQKLHNMLLYLKGVEPVRHARAEHCV